MSPRTSGSTSTWTRRGVRRMTHRPWLSARHVACIAIALKDSRPSHVLEQLWGLIDGKDQRQQRKPAGGDRGEGPLRRRRVLGGDRAQS